MSDNVHFGPDQPNCPAHFCPFCPKKGQRDFFLKNLFWPLFTPYCSLTSCKKSKKLMTQFLSKSIKTHFGSIFGPFGPKSVQEIFFQNRGPSLFSLYGHKLSRMKEFHFSRTQTFANDPIFGNFAHTNFRESTLCSIVFYCFYCILQFSRA